MLQNFVITHINQNQHLTKVRLILCNAEFHFLRIYNNACLYSRASNPDPLATNPTL